MVTELVLKVLLEINKHFPLLNTTSSKPHVFNTITIYVFANTNSRVSFDFGTKTYKQKYGQYKIRISPSRIGSSSKLSKWEMKDNESLSGRELCLRGRT